MELEAYEGELSKLRAIVKHNLLAERLEGVFFICGQTGMRDANGLPENILICPAFGADWFQVYARTDKSHGPEW